MNAEQEFKGRAELDRFLESLRADKKSDGTVLEYEIAVRMMLKYTDKEPRDISIDDIEKYKQHMVHEKQYSTGNLVRHLAILKVFFKFVEMPVANKIRTPRRPKPLPRFLSEGEMARLLKVAREESARIHAIIAVTYYGGLRVSEVANLNISDIDFENKRVRINRGKGKKDRITYLHQDALDALKEYLPKRMSPKDGCEAVFVSNWKTRFTIDAINIIVKKCAVKAGIMKKVTPHVLRHTLGATMRRHGAELLDIKDQLGHESVASTMIYTQIENEAVKKAYEKSVPSLEREQKEPLLNEKYPNNEDIRKLLDYKYLKGDLSERIYEELKEKYSTKHRSGELLGYA